MLTDNVYELFVNLKLDPHTINAGEFILLPHQVIPKYYIISEPDVNKLILHYSLGSGKTAAAVFVILHYLDLYRKYKFMAHYAKMDSDFMEKYQIKQNVIVVGAWQTQSQIEIELMRPEFGIVKTSDYKDMQRLISSTILENRQAGEDKRKQIIRELDRDIHFCGYQSFFNIVFPTIKSESYGQNVETLINEYKAGNIHVSKDFLDRFRDSIIVVDEMQRLYSVDGLNSFGVALLALSKLSHEFNIKIVFLTGTMINSSVREIVDIMNIISDDKMFDYDDYITQTVSKEGLNVVKIKPDKHDEIVRFFSKYFMFYNQAADKVVDTPRIFTFQEMHDMMLNRNKEIHKKVVLETVKKDESNNDNDNDKVSNEQTNNDNSQKLSKDNISLSDLAFMPKDSSFVNDNQSIQFINEWFGGDISLMNNISDKLLPNVINGGSLLNNLNNSQLNKHITFADDTKYYYNTNINITDKISRPKYPHKKYSDKVTNSSGEEEDFVDDGTSAIIESGPKIDRINGETVDDDGQIEVDNSDYDEDNTADAHIKSTTNATLHDDLSVSSDIDIKTLPFIGFNEIFYPSFVRENKNIRYLTYPKVDYIPQEIHIGNQTLNDVTALQPMILYTITVEGLQAKAYSQYISNYLSQFSNVDDSQQSENTIYIQDAYVPPAEEWMKHGIFRDANGNLYGKFLAMDNIRQYSAVGYEMLRLCFENTYAREKTILYHNKLNAFGINQYALILQYNGFIKYGTSPVDKSICRECYKTYIDHNQSLEYRTSHRICNTFKPMCYAVLSGALNQFERDNLTNNIFNNANNLYGDLISIMFVSDVAYSGVSFFNTNNLIILSRIPNISKWKQIYSRIIRTRSHQALPPEKQYAKIYTLTIDYPNELQKWKSTSGYTVGSLYYKQREVANEDIKQITNDIADNCISSILFKNPTQYQSTDKALHICNELLRTDIKANMQLILRRIMFGSMRDTWMVSTFLRRLKDPRYSISFINLRNIDPEVLLSFVNELRLTDMFKYEKESNTKFIKYRKTINEKATIYSTFDVYELNNLKLTTSNIKTLLHKLEEDTSMASVLIHLSRLLKLCKKNYLSIVNSTAFWDRMYEIGNEYYADDDTNFIHNHTHKGRNQSTYIGCYYGNEVIMRDGTSKVINYRFPIAVPKPGMPYTFKITCLTVSENSPFYIHVNIVKFNKEDNNDRRKINKGIICTSIKLDGLFKYFPTIDKSQPKKHYCRELLWVLCDMQEQFDDYKFVFSPFEK